MNNYAARAVWVILALAGVTVWAETPAASKAAKQGGPVFLDLGALIQTAPVSPPSPAPAVAPTNAAAPSVVNAGSNAAPATVATLNGYVPDDKYKLRVGDRISLQILEDRDAPRSLVVADSGELDVPYVGRVAAADKTCKQLAEELKAQLEKEYYLSGHRRYRSGRGEQVPGPGLCLGPGAQPGAD